MKLNNKIFLIALLMFFASNVLASTSSTDTANYCRLYRSSAACAATTATTTDARQFNVTAFDNYVRLLQKSNNKIYFGPTAAEASSDKIANNIRKHVLRHVTSEADLPTNTGSRVGIWKRKKSAGSVSVPSFSSTSTVLTGDSAASSTDSTTTDADTNSGGASQGTGINYGY